MASSPAGASIPAPSPQDVRDELRRILSSQIFATGDRSRRFLTYVVEETLAGRQDSVKELILGLEVFDRPKDFDPRTDTIVRVEAGKLRKRLQEYYQGEGVAAPLRIEIPKGSYVPQFLPGRKLRPPANSRMWILNQVRAGQAAMERWRYVHSIDREAFLHSFPQAVGRVRVFPLQPLRHFFQLRNSLFRFQSPGGPH